ncbi:MAG TPA: exonuclease SbcCD subunit D C-terminal domain-containing protein [Gaiellaceae bacterium]|jgi:exonuclease SbcD|nr:exonuclease SbcCD subunit D C-terminal domain-containing protein [Gaiellaceae bacterium]
MRLLHVSDWHLGRLTYRCPRAPDHEAVLVEICELAREVRPHLVLHTGDVFDGLRPGYAEMTFAIEVLEELAAVAPVVVLAGNHDSPALFRLFDRLQGPEPPIRFVDRVRPPQEGGVFDLPAADGEIVRLACLPFIHANRMVDRFEDATTWTATYSERIQRIEEALERGLADGYDPSRHVLVFAAHLYVRGARFSGSERPLHVSEAYATRLERFPHVAYAALGHIHLPQALPRRGVTGRYAGSPIPLDFGEEREHKEVVLVEAEPGRPARVTPHPLGAGRPLRTIVGTLEEIAELAATVGSALCRVTVCTDEPVPELAQLVKELLPDATLVEVNEDCAATRLEVVEATADEADAEPGFTELFRTYLAERGTRGAKANRVLKTFETLIQAVEAEEHPRLPDIDELLLERVRGGVS